MSDQPTRNRFDQLVEATLGTLAAAVLFLMMCLTCVDVVGRYFLNKPVLGAFEATEIALAVLIFVGLPLVTLRQEHITVDLFDAMSPPWLLRVQHVIACAIGTAATGYLAWRLYLRGNTLWSAGETTAQLKITLAYLAYAMALFTALTAAIFAVVMVRPPRDAAGGEI